MLCAHPLRFVIDSWDRFIGSRKRVLSSYHFVIFFSSTPPCFKFSVAGDFSFAVASHCIRCGFQLLKLLLLISTCTFSTLVVKNFCHQLLKLFFSSSRNLRVTLPTRQGRPPTGSRQGRLQSP